MSSVTPERAPITYRLALGEDWYQIRLNEQAEADVNAFLDVMFDGVPADAAEQTRTLIGGRFATQIATARAKRGIELLVPSPQPQGVALPAAAVLVAEVVIPTPAVPDPTEVVARVARDNIGARTGVIAGTAAVRIDHSITVPESELDADGAPPTGKRIEYVIAVPDDPRWLSIDLSVQTVDAFDMEKVIANFDQAAAALSWSAGEQAK
ncbi:hypothetical protein ABIA31_002071 [Catenulispora sp. MAP5-51]|uniref:hypothetical protein n=1 Tax=Catenulispora sp. MAP5-51 TaxID=3156298 RepID=UPI003510F417